MYSSILWATDGSRHADAALAEALALLEPGGQIIAFESTTNDPAREITNAANALSVDAIVCETRGVDGIPGLMSDSLAARVLQRAKVPVIVVPSSRVAVCHPDAAPI